MRCKVDKTVSADIAAWVNRNVFKRNVDAVDLALRESAKVCNWYNSSWFRDDGSSLKCFTPPAFCFQNGKLKGVNGRHRAVLLCRHMEEFPMLLVGAGEWPDRTLREIMMRKIEKNEVIELPDLPIKPSL